MKNILARIEELEKRLATEIGPRGGKIIGKTKTGKPIYDTGEHPAHQTFNAQDHNDAADVHYSRSKGEGDSNHLMGQFHESKAKGKALEERFPGAGGKYHNEAQQHLNKAQNPQHEEEHHDPESDAQVEKHTDSDYEPDPWMGEQPESIDNHQKSDWHATHWQHEND